jgi:hypothetical protein
VLPPLRQSSGALTRLELPDAAGMKVSVAIKDRPRSFHASTPRG